MKNQLLVVVATITILYAWQFSPPLIQPTQKANISLDPPHTVSYVNLTRYIGIWYEQASIPQVNETNCIKSMANYSFNTDGTVKVLNSCERNGVIETATAKAYPNPTDIDHSNAKLLVEFQPSFGFKADYWIVRLQEENYLYAVVSDPYYRNLWILYRKPYMSDMFLNFIINDLKDDGFPVEKLVRTKQ